MRGVSGKTMQPEIQILRLSNVFSMCNHWKQVYSEDDSSYCEQLYKDEKYLEISLSLFFSVASGLEIKLSSPRDADRLDI